ncbi:CGNR zinc finger domain-containing protein [Streptomyces sp. NPDC060194]|uniref:CGNR zinc finger domain-containing protein n=1 Tax=Streptomyces sp. NPDC060194 TaxID=3347069 RepID=UPI003646D1EB
MSTPPPDPRPLTGEPLPLDLLNTRWVDGGGPRDLLRMPDGVRTWLASAGLDTAAADDPATSDALLATREALAVLVGADAQADRAQAVAALNRTLARGRVRRELGPDGPAAVVETDTPAWLPAWRAAEGYLRLVEADPGGLRVRKCANPACVLHFHDTSKNGGRRWCSMAGCGNRAKASRHYARSRRDQAATSG